ncbi:MAG: lactate utilization protein C [Pirellulales bacterium]
MNREEFLQRVRTAAAAGRNYRVAVNPNIDRAAGYVGAGDDAIARFAEQAAAAGGQVDVVDDPAAGLDKLTEICTRYAARECVAWDHPLLERWQVRGGLEAQGVHVSTAGMLAGEDAATRRQRLLAADLGVTSVGLAVAETGSLAMFDDAGCDTVASLLPPVHVALIGPEQIVADLFDVFDALEARKAAGWPSSVVFITGPSKTGDVELKLTTGVHGPKHWHLIVSRT